MTNYSRTTLRELKKRYLNIVKKCLLANVMMFAFSLPAHSGTATDADSLMAELEKNERTVVESGTYTLTYDKTSSLYDTETNSIIFPNVTTSISLYAEMDRGRGGKFGNLAEVAFESDLKLVFKDNFINVGGSDSRIAVLGNTIYNTGTLTFNAEVDFLNNHGETTVGGGARVRGAVYNEGKLNFNQHVNFKNNTGVSLIKDQMVETTGVFNKGGTVIFETANFIGNKSGREDDGFGAGASALRNQLGGKITFTGVANFEDNKSFDKGGLQGAVIVNKDTDSTITFLSKATFKNNEGYAMNNAQAYGGAIMNGWMGQTTPGAKIEFADVDFIGNKAIGSSDGSGGAIVNKDNNTIIFNGTALFQGNIVEGKTGYACGSVIRNYINASIIFKEKPIFKGNIAKGVTSATGALDNRGIVTFENGFHFSDNETILVSTDENGNEIETKRYEDIYMWTDAVTNLTGTDPNAEEYIGGGIRSRTAEGLTSTINKSSVATLVFGEESDSTGFTGVFNQTAGKTVARSETFLGGTNNILGGELETHGNEINYTAIVGQNKDETTGEVLSSGTLTHFAMGETPVEIKGLSFKEEGTNLSMSFKNGRYQLNSDVENSFGNKLMFENSVLAIKDGTNISGTVVATKSAIDVGVGEISVDNIDLKENSTLQLGVNSLTEHGKVNGVVTGTESSEIALTLGLEVEKGVYQLFDRDNEVSMKENAIFNIKDLKNGSYEISKKTSNELSSSLKVGKNEGKTLSAIMEKEGAHQAFKRMQTEVLSALQSNEGTSMQKAKKALSAVGSKEHPIEQSVASEHLVALQNVVQAELHGTTVGHSGGDMDPRAKVYIKGLYDRTKSSMGEGFRARSKGAVLGVQSEVTDTLTLGVGYATSQTTAKEDLRRTEVDTNTGFVSAHYQPNAWWVSGLATFSRGEYEEEKQVLSSTGKASYDVDSWGAQVMTGYDIKIENAIITPEVGLRYLSVKQEGYTDTLGTTVSGTRSDYLTALVGVKGTWDMGAIRPTAGVTVGYDIISDDVSALNTLANGASYTVNGEALDRLSTGVSLGVEADLGDRTTLKLEYSGTFRKEYAAHSGMLKLEMRF